MFELAIQSGADPAERIPATPFGTPRSRHLEHRNSLLRVLHYGAFDALPRTAREERPDSPVPVREGAAGRRSRRGSPLAMFDVGDVAGAARAGILSLSVDAVRWYCLRSRRSPTELADLYGELSVRMLSS